jgi:hypothetical protein
LFFSAPFFCRHPAIVGQSGGFDFVPAILPDTATKRRRFIYFLIHFKRRQKYYQGPPDCHIRQAISAPACANL